MSFLLKFFELECIVVLKIPDDIGEVVSDILSQGFEDKRFVCSSHEF